MRGELAAVGASNAAVRNAATVMKDDISQVTPKVQKRMLKHFATVVKGMIDQVKTQVTAEVTQQVGAQFRAKLEEKDARIAADHLEKRALHNAIQELKGFYVKTGQVISTRVDLFPEQYTSKLASLQDDLDPMPADVIKAVVVRELLQGEPLDTIFSSFEDEPLGSASIAQVHAATLRDGRKVAVKVQRPNVEAVIALDLYLLRSYSQTLTALTRRLGRDIDLV